MRNATLKKLLLLLLVAVFASVSAYAGDVTCWFPPKFPPDQAKKITDSLTAKSSVGVKPRVAQNYPEILDAFSDKGDNLVYVGSFVQAMIAAKGLGIPLAQNVNGKEFYGAWMVFPKGQNPEEILAKSPSEISYAKGASSGESGAKAATGGKAAIATPNHDASAGAVKAGKAKAGFVKSWWWEANKAKWPELDVYMVPGVSDSKNPDNILTASKSISEELRAKIKSAAMDSAEAFGTKTMAEFTGDLSFSLDLMKKGGINPATYKFD